MGKQIPLSVTFNLPDGTPVTIETGKLATQAHGSALVRVGKTMILATVVSDYKKREGTDFFPLSVDYQEKFASAGRIPGNFFRRETKLSDYEVLISRLIDRPIRPLFPDGYMHDTQVMLSLISADKETQPDAYAALAASAALAVSDIPFEGPISEVRVARINGAFHINPITSLLKEADLDLIVAATYENLMMVEGEAKECAEEDLIAAIKVAHEAIKVQCKAQLELAQLVGESATIKREVTPLPEDEDLKKEIESLTKQKIYETSKSFLDKNSRKKQFDSTKEQLVATLKETKGEEWYLANAALVARYFDKTKKATIREMVLRDRVRLDGRTLTQVRPIWTEVDYLPAAHGSSIFNRGETQALTSVTLGTKLDSAMVDNALDLRYEKFMLHYNFPAFSVGEVKPNRAPGRREVGHANLAGRSIRQVLPLDTPYTIRVVSDILESNGSSSMATVCAGSMALMDAGIPIRAAVAGIAMGMIAENDDIAILTDILGDEDALGDMDFKVTGTEKGICGCQMDLKIDGLSYERLSEALMQAREGRLHILSKMAETISQANEDLKPHAPRIVEILIDKEFIGAVIGSGGKVIQEIQATTGTVINIEEVDNVGKVSISSPNKESIDKALERINAIIYEPQVGDEFEGLVVTLQPYGAFVDYLPGKAGLLHVSEFSHSRIEDISQHIQEGDIIKVKIIEVDKRAGKVRLSHKALLPRPERNPNENYQPREDRREPRDNRNNDNRGGGDRRDNNFNRNRR